MLRRARGVPGVLAHGIAARRELVILDTAPTGHTVLLLETAEIYHRKIVEGRPPEGLARVVTPFMLLRDARHTVVDTNLTGC